MLLLCWQIRFEQFGGGDTGKPLEVAVHAIPAAFNPASVVVVETFEDEGVIAAYIAAMDANKVPVLPRDLAAITVGLGADGKGLLVAGTVAAVTAAVRKGTERLLLFEPKLKEEGEGK